MKFSGKWKERDSDRILEIFGPLPKGGDIYNFNYYDTKKEEVIRKEEVHIFISNYSHARLPDSKVFEKNIILPNENCIKIGELIFDRVSFE